MRRHELHLGPGAASLLLVIVVLCMSILGLLSLMNARTDLRMARRSAEISEHMAALDVRAEEDFARLDALLASCGDAQSHEEYTARAAQLLPEGMYMEKDTIYWTVQEDEARILECAALILPLGETPRIQWIIHRHMPVLEDSYEFG